MNILILGATGTLGTALTKRLFEETNHHLTLFSRHADESMKRYDNLKNKLKVFQQGKIDIDGELIHAVINKIIVLDEHTVVYCIPKNRIQTSEKIKLFRKKYINFPAMFEGRIDDTRNKKHYYIEYKAVMI